MERKYYFRGLGLGIAVTAIIMGAATSHGTTMTDQEIIARAKELGMVENTVLADMNGKETEESEEPDAANAGQPQDDRSGTIDEEKQPQADDKIENMSQDQKDSGEAEAEDDVSDGSGETAAGNQGHSETDEAETVQGSSDGLTEEDEEEEPDGSNKQTGQNRETDKTDFENETAAGGGNITVSRGDGSHTVAKKLADAGLVLSADSFDQFLCQNGYDKKLRTGTFHIPSDADHEQIAKIITGVE